MRLPHGQTSTGLKLLPAVITGMKRVQAHMRLMGPFYMLLPGKSSVLRVMKDPSYVEKLT
jgi:hypothetical protein